MYNIFFVIIFAHVIIIVLFQINKINCDFCYDKKSKKLKDFDGSRRNLIRFDSATSCAINYFDVGSISQLALNVIHDAKSLRFLDLSSNRISTILNDTFNQFLELENLKLGDNFLIEVQTHYFNGLQELSILNLSSNLISNIEKNSFKSLKSLLWLNLANNCILNIALNLPPVALYSLNLSRNLIEKFPLFKNIGSIDSLDLSCNSNGVLNFNADTKFSRTIKSIKSLNIADNELSNLMQLESFINLDELNLANNPIDYTTDFLPHFMELRKLNISGTNLTSLDVFKKVNFKQFTMLSIDKNPLKADFVMLKRFTSLRHLHFSASFCYELESFPELLMNFQHLVQVFIQYQTSTCKCAKKNEKHLSLHRIKFSTDWHHVCSKGQTLREQHRYNGVVYFFGLIVFQALRRHLKI